MNQFSLSLVDQHFPSLRNPFAHSPWCVLLESIDAHSLNCARASLEQLLEQAMENVEISDVVLCESLSQAQNMWQLRECIPLAQAAEGINVKHDISVPISQMVHLTQTLQKDLLAAFPGVRLVTFGHLGDGNLHYNVQAPVGINGQTFLEQNEKRINKLVYDAVHLVGGSISTEHGIGSLKSALLPQYKSPVALQMMRSIKAALDPQNILNPTRVLA